MAFAPYGTEPLYGDPAAPAGGWTFLRNHGAIALQAGSFSPFARVHDKTASIRPGLQYQAAPSVLYLCTKPIASGRRFKCGHGCKSTLQTAAPSKILDYCCVGCCSRKYVELWVLLYVHQEVGAWLPYATVG